MITAVATTEPTADKTTMTTPIHEQLGSRGLLPSEHLAGSGYPSAELIVHAARTFGITLVSPVRLDSSAQARAGADYDKAAFSIDSGACQATCPQGTASSSWNPCRQHHDEVIVVSWPKSACAPCPARQLCTSGQRRQINIRSRDLHEALAAARAERPPRTGIRRPRYLGLPKTQLEHNIAAAQST